MKGTLEKWTHWSKNWLLISYYMPENCTRLWCRESASLMFSPWSEVTWAWWVSGNRVPVGTWGHVSRWRCLKCNHRDRLKIVLRDEAEMTACIWRRTSPSIESLLASRLCSSVSHLPPDFLVASPLKASFSLYQKLISIMNIHITIWMNLIFIYKNVYYI